MNFDSFSVNFGGGGPGDDFVLDTASATRLSAIPTNGSAFTIDCGGTGGTCNNALGSIVSITTSDGSLNGVPATSLPPVAFKEVSIRCTSIGSSLVTVPANISAYIMSSGATKIQASYFRGNLQTHTSAGANAGNTVNIVSGHAIAGFTTP